MKEQGAVGNVGAYSTYLLFVEYYNRHLFGIGVGYMWKFVGSSSFLRLEEYIFQLPLTHFHVSVTNSIL